MGGRKILITGASGFIGQALCHQLGDTSADEIVLFDGDLLDTNDVEKFFTSHGLFDQIIHLVGTFGDDLTKLYRLNVEALYNLISCALTQGQTKIIFTSTGAVYGDAKDAPLVETDPLEPNTAYGLSKKWAEDVIYYFHQIQGLNYTILRFPNVYGPGSTKGVIYNFTSSIENNHSITLFGDGEQSRNFLHVEDAARAIITALDYPKNGVFNISTQKSYSLNNIIDKLKEKYEFTVEHKPANNNLRHLVLNPEKATAELKFTPKYEDIQL